MTLQDWIKVGTSIIAAISSLGLFKWARDKYKHFKKNRDTARALQAEISTHMMEEITAIKAQVMPNGGNSLNDKINEIVKWSKGIDETLIELRREVKIGQRNNREIQNIASWESDGEGRVLYVSVALCDLIGCTQTDILSNGWVGLVDEADRHRVFDEWKKSVSTGYEFNSIFSFRKNDGTKQKVRATALHNKDKDGKVINTLCRLIQIDEPYKLN